MSSPALSGGAYDIVEARGPSRRSSVAAAFSAGAYWPFIMLHPLISPPGFLASAAGVPNQTRTAVLIFFLGSAIAIASASAGWRVFHEYSSAIALWLFALAVASFALQAVGNSHILSMLSLS